MRYNFYYILELQNKLPPDIDAKFRGQMKSGNIFFEFIRYEARLAALINSTLADILANRVKVSNKDLTEVTPPKTERKTTRVAVGQRARHFRNGEKCGLRKRSMTTGGFSSKGSHSKQKRPEKYLFIFNTGHWCLMFKTLIDYLIDIHQVHKALQDFKKTTFGKSTRIVWLNMLPFGDSSALANDFAVMAANFYASQLFQPLGIDIVDQFSLMYARSHEQVCKGHYLCVNQTESASTMYGTVGKEVLNQILQQYL